MKVADGNENNYQNFKVNANDNFHSTYIGSGSSIMVNMQRNELIYTMGIREKKGMVRPFSVEFRHRRKSRVWY